ncbi:MAG: WYL domain-containing protein, partial [Armatimonadetes bacterium]|nr:WYL domain-containing protein [Armatimonadota bacterium]
FEIPKDFSYQEFIRNAFGILRSEEPVDVAVEFRGFEARLARERTWHESQRMEEKKDGAVIIHLKVTGIEEVKRWILSSGKDAKVLEPLWLAEEMEKELGEAAMRYKSFENVH